MRVAVIGGGISGLAASWFLRQELGDAADIVVLEKKDDIGGHLRVSDVAGLPVDEGAESLLARRPEAVDLVQAVGLGDDLTHPADVDARIWSHSNMWPIPPGTIMGVPSSLDSFAGLLTDDELAETHRDASPGLPIDGDVAIGPLVEARMGRAVVDRLVDPMLGGVYAGRADELSVDATIPALGAALRSSSSLVSAVRSLVPTRTPQDRANGTPAFAGIVGGVGRLPLAIAKAAGADVRAGVTVRRLETDGDHWQITTGPVPAPLILDADAVVVAVPPAPSVRLLRGVADAAANELAGIETASMAIVTIAVPADAFAKQPSTSGFLVPAVEGRTIKAVTYSSVKWPWLGRMARDLVILRASVGRHRRVDELQCTDGELIDRVGQDLHDLTGLTAKPVDARVTRWGGALPQYAVGHRDRVARIRRAVDTVPGLAVCGAVYEGVGIAACIAAARSAVTSLLSR